MNAVMQLKTKCRAPGRGSHEQNEAQWCVVDQAGAAAVLEQEGSQ